MFDNHFLEIDLTSFEVKVLTLESNVLERFYGGGALSAYLLFKYLINHPERFNNNLDTYIVFCKGLLKNYTGFKSIYVSFPDPVYGNYNEGVLKGEFAHYFSHLKWSGFTIKGASDSKSVIIFDDKTVKIEEIDKPANESIGEYLKKLYGDVYSIVFCNNLVKGSCISDICTYNGNVQYSLDLAGLAGLFLEKNLVGILIKKDVIYNRLDIDINNILNDLALVNNVSYILELNKSNSINEIKTIIKDASANGRNPCGECTQGCFFKFSVPYFDNELALPRTMDWISLLMLDDDPIKAIKKWQILEKSGMNIKKFISIFKFLKETVDHNYEIFNKDAFTFDKLLDSLLNNKSVFRYLNFGIYKSAKYYHIFGNNAAYLIRNFECIFDRLMYNSPVFYLLNITNISQPDVFTFFWRFYVAHYNKEWVPFFIDESTHLYIVKSSISYQIFSGVMGILGMCPYFNGKVTRKMINDIFSSNNLSVKFKDLQVAASRWYMIKRLFNYKKKKFAFDNLSWRFLINFKMNNNKGNPGDFQKLIFLYYVENGLNEFGFPKEERLNELNMEDLNVI